MKIKIFIKRALELQEIIQNVAGHPKPAVDVNASTSEAVSEEELPRGPIKIKRPNFLKKKYKPEDIKPDPTASPANRARKLSLLLFFFKFFILEVFDLFLTDIERGNYAVSIRTRLGRQFRLYGSMLRGMADEQ